MPPVQAEYWLIFKSFLAREKGFKGLPLSARLVSIFSKPYANVKIAFKSDTDPYALVSYTIGIHGVVKTEMNFIPPEFKFMKFRTKRSRVVEAQGICEYFYTWGIDTQLDYWKMARIQGTISYYLNCPPSYLPTRDTTHWICSEWISFIMKESGLIQKDAPPVHHSYISPTELFLYAYHYGRGYSWEESFHPFPILLKKRKGKSFEETNAVVFYRHIMGVPEEDPIPTLTSSNCMAIALFLP